MVIFHSYVSSPEGTQQLLVAVFLAQNILDHLRLENVVKSRPSKISEA